MRIKSCFVCHKSFILSIVLLLLSVMSGFTQLPPDTMWTKTFPGIYSDIARQVQPTSDGGYIIAGESESFGPGIWSVYVVKTDSAGEVEWNKTYGGANFDFPYAIRQTTDGGYIVGTYTTSFPPSGTNLRLIKLDEAGDTVWTAVLPNSNGKIVNTASCIVQAPDGGFLIAGYGWTPPYANQICVFKTDPAGALLWNKNYGGSSDDFGAAIQSTNDGNFILAGYTYSFGSGQCDGYLIKIDQQGDTIWTGVHGGTSYDSYRFVRPASDNGYIAVGTTQSFGNAEQAYAVKTNELGGLQWSVAVGGGINEAFEGVCENENHEYVLSGTTNSFGNGQHDFLIARIGSAGNILGTNTYGGPGEDFGATIEKTGDGGYVATGSYTGSSYLDFWLLKFAPDSIATAASENLAENITGLNNFPNPFQNETVITYNLTREMFVELKVLDYLGKELANPVSELQIRGHHYVKFNASDLSTGIYFYQIQINGISVTRKMLKVN